MKIRLSSYEISTNTATRKVIQEFRASSDKKAMLLNAIYYPALIQVVADMIQELGSDEESELRDKRWFQAIVEVGERENFEITADSNPFRIAQKVLRQPFRALKNSYRTSEEKAHD